MSSNRVVPIGTTDGSAEMADMAGVNVGGVAISGEVHHKKPTKAVPARKIYFSHNAPDYPCCFK